MKLTFQGLICTIHTFIESDFINNYSFKKKEKFIIILITKIQNKQILSVENMLFMKKTKKL